ncbi:hypothetical protein V5J34_004954 [Endozoicomonas sp. NE35]
MELNDWIDELGGVRRAASVLGVKWRTVDSWYYMQRSPSRFAAINIVIKSRGKVDFNGIYKPFLRKEADV